MAEVYGSILKVPLPTDTRVHYQSTNGYIVGRSGAILIDPAADTPALDQACEKQTIELLVLTHTHSDHIGAVGTYVDRYDPLVIAHENYTALFEKRTGIAADQTMGDGDTIIAGDGTEMSVVSTPGHAVDHVAFAVESDLISGDLVFESGSVYVGGDGGNMRAYLESLELITISGYDRLFPGHGPVITNPTSTIERLLEHRLAREKTILTAIREGARTPEEVVAAVYDRDLSGIRDLAVKTTIAHLEKLADDGIIGWDGDRINYPL